MSKQGDDNDKGREKEGKWPITAGDLRKRTVVYLFRQRELLGLIGMACGATDSPPGICGGRGRWEKRKRIVSSV
jgi:hypothetical protein